MDITSRPRSRPRAQAIADQPTPWWLATLLGLGLALAAASAWAQDTKTSAPAPQSAGTSDGVVTPPSVDPAIHVKPPVDASMLPTPVVPPPGTQGGDTKVVPK